MSSPICSVTIKYKLYFEGRNDFRIHEVFTTWNFFLVENKQSKCMKFIRCLTITFQRSKILRLLLHWQLLTCRNLFFFFNFQLSFCSLVQCDFEKRCIFSLHESTKIINNIEDTRQKIKCGCPVHICKMLCPHWFFIFQKHYKFVCNSNIVHICP